MRMTFESPERLRIELDPDDMNDLNVTVEELDYSSDKTRRVLHELLERIGAQALLSCDTGKRLIEVFPATDGGCVIYFTAIHKAASARPARGRADASVWAIGNADDLLAAVEALRSLGPQSPAALYRLGQEYRLVLQAPSAKQELLLSEFARRLRSPNAARLTAEHGTLLSARVLSDVPVSAPPREATPPPPSYPAH